MSEDKRKCKRMIRRLIRDLHRGRELGQRGAAYAVAWPMARG